MLVIILETVGYLCPELALDAVYVRGVGIDVQFHPSLVPVYVHEHIEAVGDAELHHFVHAIHPALVYLKCILVRMVVPCHRETHCIETGLADAADIVGVDFGRAPCRLATDGLEGVADVYGHRDVGGSLECGLVALTC